MATELAVALLCTSMKIWSELDDFGMLASLDALREK